MNGRRLREIGTEIGALVAEKDLAYGSAFEKCGDFLRLLYPEGVRPEQYVAMLALVRIFDKQMRIATAPGAFNEDPARDIVGYGVLLVAIGEQGPGAPTWDEGASTQGAPAEVNLGDAP